MVFMMNQVPTFPLETPVHARADLPVRPPDPLFGRDADLSSIQLVLQARTAVLLHGPAGLGKTALAAAVAAHHVDRPGGVLWLEQHDDALPSLVARVLRAYRQDTAGIVEDLDAQCARVHDVLTERRPLVVLDGTVNHDAARLFVRECAAGVPVVLTHAKLVPGPWTPHAVEALAPDAAEAMLVQLAGNSLEAHMSEVANLLKVLGGSPLAIRVAGLQLASGDLTPGDFANRMPPAPAGEPNAPIAALMAAYRLLPSALQGLLLLVGSAFTSRLSEDLLAQVGGAPPHIIRSTMRDLAGRGFVDETSRAGEPVFVVHERIQAFAQAFLRGKKQLDAMRERHARGIVAYAARQAEGDDDGSAWRLAHIMPDILSTAAYAAQHQDSELLADLREPFVLGEMRDRLAAHGYEPEIEWLVYLDENPLAADSGLLAHLPEEDLPLEAVPVGGPAHEDVAVPAALAPEPDDLDVQEQDTVASAPVSGLDEVLDAEDVMAEEEAVPAAPMPVRAEPMAPKVAGAAPRTIEAYTEALETYQADGDVDDELRALEALAELSLQQGNFQDVLEYIDRGQALAQQADNPLREGHMLLTLGDLQLALGRTDGAEQAYQEAISALRPTEDWGEIGVALDRLGGLYLEVGRYHDAIMILEQAVPIFEREHQTGNLIAAMDQLGESHAGLNQWERALAYHTQALALAQGEQDDEAAYEQLTHLGLASEASGDQESAQFYYQQALHLAFQIGDKVQQGETMLALARLLINDTVQLNRVVQLLEAADQALPGDVEIERLLNRARTRQQRLVAAGVDLEAADDSLEEYARSAFE